MTPWKPPKAMPPLPSHYPRPGDKGDRATEPDWEKHTYRGHERICFHDAKDRPVNVTVGTLRSDDGILRFGRTGHYLLIDRSIAERLYPLIRHYARTGRL